MIWLGIGIYMVAALVTGWYAAIDNARDTALHPDDDLNGTPASEFILCTAFAPLIWFATTCTWFFKHLDTFFIHRAKVDHLPEVVQRRQEELEREVLDDRS